MTTATQGEPLVMEYETYPVMELHFELTELDGTLHVTNVVMIKVKPTLDRPFVSFRQSSDRTRTTGCA